MKFTLKDMAEAGYIMGLQTIGEVATHMECHHCAYFETAKFNQEMAEFEAMIDGHETDSVDLYLSAEDKKKMDDELEAAFRGSPDAPPEDL